MGQEEKTIAQTFDVSKYFKIDDECFVKRTFVSKHCAYQINFIDGSSTKVVMTRKQRESMNRRKDYDKIKTIGGLGYRFKIK